MEKLNFTVFINAPAAKVWDTMLGDATYRKWTEAFMPGSYYKGSWDQGSEIRFLGPNPDGTPGEGGMLARIKVNRLHEYMSIEHFGVIANGVEDTTSDEIKKFVPACENYTFTPKDGGTEVLVEMDTAPEYKEMFSETWPKALQSVKELAEKK